MENTWIFSLFAYVYSINYVKKIIIHFYAYYFFNNYSNFKFEFMLISVIEPLQFMDIFF